MRPVAPPQPDLSRPALAEDDILAVQGLNIAFRTPAGAIPAVQDVSFRVRQGETLALVGESGSGKSVTSLGILRLTPRAPFCDISGQVLLRGRDGTVRDLVSLPEAEMRQVRGRDAAMVFQEPMTSLNPVHRVGDQIAESIRFHENLGRRAALDKAAGLLELVGIPDPRRRLAAYPHEMSGGMRQRVMIAMALACEPKLLIADEPTTALDVTIQAQILDLLRRLQEKTRMAVIFITHNLGVVAEIADRVMVMYSGRVVEQGAVRPLFKAPLMPYTRGLLRSVPRLDFAGLGREPLAAIPGTVPDPLEPPPGCSFGPRCADFRAGECDVTVPPLEQAMTDRQVRCVRWAALAGETV